MANIQGASDAKSWGRIAPMTSPQLIVPLSGEHLPVNQAQEVF